VQARNAAARHALPVPGPTPQQGTGGVWIQKVKRIRAVQGQRARAKQPLGGHQASPPKWLSILQRARAAVRRLLRRPKRHLGIEEFTPAVRERGWPKGANALAGSLVGDNAMPCSRKGWSA